MGCPRAIRLMSDHFRYTFDHNKKAMKTWSAADAKRRFARVLKDAATEPQLVELRGKPVGVVVSYQSYTRNKKAFSQKSLARWLEELEPLHDLEGDMELPPRRDRPDMFSVSAVTLEELVYGLRCRSMLTTEAWLRRMLADKADVMPVTVAPARWSGEKRAMLESGGRAVTQEPLTLNRGAGHAIPASRSPSSPSAYAADCPVFGTFETGSSSPSPPAGPNNASSAHAHATTQRYRDAFPFMSPCRGTLPCRGSQVNGVVVRERREEGPVVQSIQLDEP
jgi:prevent-host-death family protein